MDAAMAFVRALSEILNAGIAITAFSLLIYALTFNLRVRIARTFAFILLSVLIGFAGESIASTATDLNEIDLWLRFQWIGIVLLPAAYFHFSDALLATTGKPSRGRRKWVARGFYLLSALFLVGLPMKWLIGPAVVFTPVPRLQPTVVTDLFLIYYAIAVILAWYNFVRAYRRTTTSASRRRLGYLLAGAMAPAIGSFPFLPFSPGFVSDHPFLFWSLSVAANLVVGTLIVVMAYSVAFFGVGWPDRVVRARLFKWILRGPFTASLTLGVVTLIRRGGQALDWNTTLLVPIVTPAVILISEHLITLLAPLGERLFFFGNDRRDLEMLSKLETQLVTSNDLKQFLEMILAALSDLLQSKGAYVIALEGGGSELVLVNGQTRFDGTGAELAIPQEIIQSAAEGSADVHRFRWGSDTLIPLFNGTSEKPEMIGLVGVCEASRTHLDPDQLHSLDVLIKRTGMALRDRRVQQQIFRSLEELSMQADLIQRLRAAGRYDREAVLASEDSLGGEESLEVWVKEALTHYWGGPRLTASPLLSYKIVQDELKAHDGNQANALRGILRRAIEQIRPEGERRFTADWILYNILEMKFLEGKKVREVALRLAMSEADLYRKQRVAIESVARAIVEMENQARHEEPKI